MSSRLDPSADRSEADDEARAIAEAEGTPFLIYLDGGGDQQLYPLTGSPPVVAVGQASEAEISLPFDDEVSGLHVEFASIGGEWVVIDDGVSSTGTFVNDKKVEGRRRLRDRDLVRVGQTGIIFRNPADPAPERVATDPAEIAASLTDTQRRILVALCRPFRKGTKGVMPATDRAIAEDVSLGVQAVAGHIQVMLEKFGLSELPENRRRISLAAYAFKSGAVKAADLR